MSMPGEPSDEMIYKMECSVRGLTLVALHCSDYELTTSRKHYDAINQATEKVLLECALATQGVASPDFEEKCTGYLDEIRGIYREYGVPNDMMADDVIISQGSTDNLFEALMYAATHGKITVEDVIREESVADDFMNDCMDETGRRIRERN